MQLFPLGIIINTLLTNGIGLPENFKRGETRGFGLTLIGIVVEQPGGRFFIETDKGTANILEFEVGNCRRVGYHAE